MTLYSLTKRASALPLVLFITTVLTRVPFTSRMLYHMDSAQYALSLDHFDVIAHQPHPPGYFLYVMAGKLFHLFIPDPNTALIALSITCSALAVVVIHDLGTRMGGAKLGILAALFAITSPNFWFHGEVALNYAVEVFLSASIALLCWRIIHKEEHLVWTLSIMLAVTGGVRQSTAVFLLPLCIFSLRMLPTAQVAYAAVLCILATAAWVVPMLLMTGVEAYLNSFRELLRYMGSHGSVFSSGLETLVYYLRCTHTAITLSIGAGVVVIGLALYHVLRHRRINKLQNSDALFMIIWVAPAIFFFTLIANHPGVPGFILILLPALVLLVAMSVIYLGNEFIRLPTTALLAGIVLSINIAMFVFSGLPLSASFIREHDKNLLSLVHHLKRSTDSHTALFIRQYMLYSFWHLAYYLPDKTSYNVDASRDKQGNMRQVFYNQDGRIRTAARIALPSDIRQYGAISLEINRIVHADCVSSDSSVANSISVTTGPIEKLGCIYPELSPQLISNRTYTNSL